MPSPNPRDLEWFQITNIHLREHHSNPAGHNLDGILAHSASNGLIYGCLLENWTVRDAIIDVSHRRRDETYVNRALHIENNIFRNGRYVKQAAVSVPSNVIRYYRNRFIDTTMAFYHHGYGVEFEENVFEGTFFDHLITTWGLTGSVHFASNVFVWDGGVRCVIKADSELSRATDHTHLTGEDNAYYSGGFNSWVCRHESNIHTFDDWLATGQEVRSVLRGFGEFRP